MSFRTKLRRWGNSYGVLIPMAEIRRRHLKAGQDIDLTFPEDRDVTKFFGSVKFKKPLQELMREIDEGYDEA